MTQTGGQPVAPRMVSGRRPRMVWGRTEVNERGGGKDEPERTGCQQVVNGLSTSATLTEMLWCEREAPWKGEKRTETRPPLLRLREIKKSLID
jgi:hypothetical protein